MDHRLQIELISTKPFIENNTQVLELIRRILAVLEPYREQYLECQEAWASPALHPRGMVKYNQAALDLIAEKAASGAIINYGVHDWDFVSKGNHGKEAFVNIGVHCRHATGSHVFGYGITLRFHPEVGRILLDNGLVSIVEELAQAISADYGYMDFQRLCPGGLIVSDLIRLSGINRKSYPEEYDLTGLLPCLCWWTLLNKEHIEALGGREAIREQAPCYAVHDLSEGHYEALSLQMTADPGEMKKRAYTALRDYLKPVIPPVNKYALALELNYRRIPLSRLKWNVSAGEMAEAEPLRQLSPAELREKAAEL